MRKTAAGKPEPASQKTTQATQTTTKDDHFTIRIPRLRFQENSLNVFLVFILIVFSFIMGMLTNKVFFLQSQLKANANVANTAPTAESQPTDVPPPPAVVKVDNGHLTPLGNKNAKVTIVEFSDFQCPFCKQYFDEAHQEIKSTYLDSNKIQFVYRHFPLTTIHPNALKAANASECAQEQSRFWDYHDILFKNQETWSPLSSTDASAAFVDYANELGMNGDQFKSCLESNKYDKKVKDDMAAGEKIQVDGTPAFFVNGVRLTGAQPFSEFQTIIDQELKK